jgi:signal transduction histidine kinase/DNA-binding response OmpR family regulator
MSVFYQPFKQTALVLIVEDDEVTRTLLRYLMETEGYRVIEASNGEEGLQAYQQFHPNIVLLDIALPGMDGFTCCASIRAVPNSQHTIVVMVTALGDSQGIDRAFAAGASDYVTKPIHLTTLQQRVQRLREQQRLNQQAEQLNASLQGVVQDCMVDMRESTKQLHKFLEFESMLKRITDKVRDSLDEKQILQAAVQELVWALTLGCCNASLYDADRRTATVRYEYAASISGYYGQTIDLVANADLYQQLLNGHCFQFCSVEPSPVRGAVSMFACPISNEQGVMGDLWLINPPYRVLDELEIRLVQQVANQCAIAIRQAKLYQAAQQQVEELTRLNQLKNDFVSTVSHELRSPLANMRMAIAMLKNCLEQGAPANKRTVYLQILQDECEREISLINDLLDLQRLEAGSKIVEVQAIDLSSWLPEVVQPFASTAQARQITLQVHLAPNLPMLSSDPISLQRILAELLHNAHKYTPPDEKITVSAMAEADRIRLQVCNSGIEIPAPELPRIFDKFYRVPSGDPWQQGGTGLGLALVKQLVEHLGGVIGVKSDAGQTCFTIELPNDNRQWIHSHLLP